MWAARCVHEASLHAHNSFITLTYSPEKTPPGETLVLEDFQKFMKRLRKKHADTNIRFFHCGEYGTLGGRPHYHALLFGLNFKDRILWQQNNGVNTYISPSLTKLWEHGFSTCGDLTQESAAYTARYILKKINGPPAASHYQSICASTGEIIDKKPEYITMSLKPGIATEWYNKYKAEIWPDDFIVNSKGKKQPVPAFYVKKLREESEQLYEQLKRRREKAAKRYEHNNTPDRLQVREFILQERTKQLKREL